jgi:cell division protein FtsW
MLQPDMGTTLVVTILAVTLYFLSGYPVKHLLVIGGIGLTNGSILIISAPYRLERVKTFLDPLHDTQGSSYHIRQVLLSLGSGGVSGLGIGRSRQKYAYLPEATTDSIFAVVGEELGFIGGTLLILSFLYYLSLIFKVATAEKDKFAATMVAGIGAWIGIQVCLNLAAMVALTPLTGVPLPLVSLWRQRLHYYVGGVGLVLSVARHQKRVKLLMNTIVITGGHHNSALVVAKELISRGHQVVWLGHRQSSRGDTIDSAEYIEVKAAGIPFHDLLQPD